MYALIPMNISNNNNQEENIRRLMMDGVENVTRTIHKYMDEHPECELHTQGKMFGVLIANKGEIVTCFQAFSAMLDGRYEHPGFVPPVYQPKSMPIGNNREQSYRLQRLLFTQYYFTNIHGEHANLLEIFSNEKPIFSIEDWFNNKPKNRIEVMPPSGAGECCAPKLLQYALSNGWHPLALTEFWIGATQKNELHQEGCFYTPCSGRCMPILRWMLGNELKNLIIGGDDSNQDINDNIEVLYEDDWLIVINKPAGLLSVPGKAITPSVEEILSERRNQGYIKAVHRLDQDTSGLLVLAKNAEVYKELQSYFQRRDIEKRYEAIVESIEDTSHANIEQRDGIIELPLLPDPYDRPRQIVNFEHGKESITAYHIRERRPDGTFLIDFFPKTGRTHQIRIHSAHPHGLNAPICGDRLYGKATGNKYQRLMLHAAEIRFMHPRTKEEMHFCIPSGF